MGSSGAAYLTQTQADARYYTQAQADARFYINEIPSDRGRVAWNIPVQAATSAALLGVAGTLQLFKILKVPATTISAITIAITVGGGTLTAGQCFAALYALDGTLLSQSVDQSVAWATTGPKTMALAAPVAVSAVPLYAGLWWNGTTAPTCIRSTNTTGNGNITNLGTTAPTLLSATADTGLTTTAPATFGGQTVGASQVFVALS